jgi:hypothetical protein
VPISRSIVLRGDAELAQGTVVVRGPESEVDPADRQQLEGEHNILDRCMRARIRDAPEDLAKDQVANE